MKNAKDIFMYSLAALIILLLFLSLYFILTKSVPQENRDLAYMSFGLALGWGTMVISYFFGSSKGSADKNEMMHSYTKPKQDYTIIRLPGGGFQGKFSDNKLTPVFDSEDEVRLWVNNN
jgi:hypothetical protein